MKRDVICAQRAAYRTVFLVSLAVVIALGSWQSAATADVFSNVPEASGFGVVYVLPIPDFPDFDATIPYSVNNSAGIADGSFSRVAYYLELEDTNTGYSEWVYASFDAAPFATEADMLGIPTTANGIVYQYNPSGATGQVMNMNVFSNDPGITTGYGITTGNAEIWPTNYSDDNGAGVPGSPSNDAYDFGDTRSTSGGHGSFQIHNYGAGETLFAINHFNGGEAEMGIGSQSTGNPDWTFNETSADYEIKNLVILAGNPLSWNGGGGTTGPLDGSGTWDASSTNWWDSASAAWTDGSNAVFGAGSGNGVAGTVTISGTVKPASIAFNETGDGNSYTLTGGTIDLNGSVMTIRANVNATINSTLTNGGIEKLGAGNLSLGGTNTLSGTTTVSAGTLTLGATSNNTLGTVNVKGGAAGARLVVEGTTDLGSNNMNVATAAADRSTVVISGNATMNRLYVGDYGAGAVIQDGGSVTIGPTLGGQNVLSLGFNGGYGYYQMNGGSLTVGQLAAGSSSGSNDIGVFDMNGGTVDVTGGGGWLLAGGWATNAKGSFNLWGGTMTGPASNAVTLNVFARSSTGMLNMLGSTAVLDATKNSGGLNVMREANVSSIVNLNAGTIIASRVQQSGAGSAQFNFNGGTLQAKADASVTFSLNTGGSAYIYGGDANFDGGAYIDTPTSATTLTITTPLLAPTGYGATSVAIADAGAGYVGAPFVVLSGGSGVGASAIAQVDLDSSSPTYGQLTNILITSAGSGYAAGDVLTATLYGGGATTAATLGSVTLGANTSGGLTKIGDGTLVLTADSTYTGATTVTGGTLSVSGGSLDGTRSIIIQTGGAMTIANATVTMGSSSSGVFGIGYGVSGTGEVTVGDGGVLNVGNGGSRTFIGGADYSGGPAGSGTLNINGTGQVNIAAAGSFPNEKVYVSGWGGSGTINLNGGTLTSARSIKHGSGNGPSIVNFEGGTLRAGASIALEASLNGAYVKAGGAILDSNTGYTLTIYEPLLHDSALGATLDGGVTVRGSGTVTLAGANTYSGDTTIRAGTLRIANADAIPSGAGKGNVAVDGALDVAGYTANVNGLSGAGTINNSTDNGTLVVGNNNADGVFSGVIRNTGGSLALAKVGNGTLTLTGNNSYSGGTTVSQGTLAVGSPTPTAVNPLGSGSVALAGGTLKLSGQAALVSTTEHPVTVTGWDKDFVWANSEPAAEGGSDPILNNWVYYEAGPTHNGGLNGLPTSRTFVSAADSSVTFQIEPYDGANSVWLSGTATTLTLDTPGHYSSLHLLDASGNGVPTVTYTLTFADSSTTTGTFQPLDWTHYDSVLTSLAQRSTSGGTYYTNAGLSQTDIVFSSADQAKLLSSISFTAAGGGGSWIMGVSGTSGTLGYAPTQTYGNAVNVTADSTIDVRNSLAATLGSLSIGNHTLSLTGDSGASLTVGTTTLSGNATFNTAADTTLNVGAIGDGSAGHGITKTGAGTMTLGGHCSYGGATVITEGTICLDGTTTQLGNIMPLGDSITYGSRGTDAGYRGPLYTLLTDDGYSFQYVGSQTNNPGSLPTMPIDQTHHEGHSGWTVAGILNGVTPSEDGGLGWLTVNPDIITLMIGTNNRGGGEAGVPTAIGELEELIDTVSAETPDAALFVAEIIPIPGQEAFVSAYNTSLVSLVASKQADGADIYLVDLNSEYPDDALADGLHPNDTGYEWMAEQWYSAILAALGSTADDVLPSDTPVQLAGAATLDLNGISQTVASLADYGGSGGAIVNGNSTTPLVLTINPSDGSTSFSGTISDSGAAGAISLVKSGAGTQILAGANTYHGGTEVNEGVLLVNNTTGSGTGSGNVVVNGGTLGGSGTIAGLVTVTSGTLAPGNSPGILTLESGLTMTGGTFAVELDGLVEGTEYDQLLVTDGTVNLGEGVASLALSLGFTPEIDDLFWIINNTGEGETTGYFQGLEEGSRVEMDGGIFRIRYGADYASGLFAGGNDVLLIGIPEPATLLMLFTLGLLACRRRRR